MKYFTNAVTDLRELPLRTSHKVAELPLYTIVESDGNNHAGWLEVTYKDKRGWVVDSLVELYQETLPKNCVKISDQTPDPYDFEQYVLINGIKNPNLCGELAVCFALGIDLKSLMATWEVKAPSLWKRIKGGGRFSGTNWQDLDIICDLFNVDAKPLEAYMTDPYLKRSRYTPASFEKACEDGYPLVACKIDGNTGRLRGQGIGHWVIVTGVETERFGGQVYLYNPAPNRIEQYSWQEFIASAVVPFGLWIPKEGEE